MHLDNGAVEGNRFDLDADDLFFLKLREDPVQHAGFGPAVHAGVDGMPVAEPFRQAPPLAAMFSDEQNRVEYLQIG